MTFPRFAPTLLLTVLITGLWFSSCGEKAAATSGNNEAVAVDSGWISLFDGSSLDAWRNYRQDTISPQWQIEDGALMLAGSGGGDIVTKEKFESFELEIEWKISEAGNSGIFFHVVEADSLGAVYASGPELQVLDDDRHPDGKLPSHRAGANYDLHPCRVVNVKPVGEWNHIRLVVDKGHVIHYQNGESVVDYQIGSPEWQTALAASKFADWPMYARAGSGHIALQDHGDKVWFRNIRIRRL